MCVTHDLFYVIHCTLLFLHLRALFAPDLIRTSPAATSTAQYPYFLEYPFSLSMVVVQHLDDKADVPIRRTDDVVLALIDDIRQQHQRLGLHHQ